TYKPANGGLVDLSGITLIYETTSAQRMRRILKLDQQKPLAERAYLPLNVEPIPVELREEYAKTVINTAFEGFGPDRKAKLLVFYQPIFDHMIQLDLKFARNSKVDIP